MDRDRLLSLRILIGLAFVDRKLNQKELSWIRHFMKSQNFAENESQQIETDLKSPPNPVELFQQISNQEDRNQVIGMARVLLHIDGKVHHLERQIFDQLCAIHTEMSQNLDAKMKNMASSILMTEDRKEYYRELEKLGSALSERAGILALISPFLAFSKHLPDLLLMSRKTWLTLGALAALAIVFFLGLLVLSLF